MKHSSDTHRRSRQAPIKPPEVVRFKVHESRRLRGLGIETLSLAQLKERGSPDHLAAVQRLEFLLFVLYTPQDGKNSKPFTGEHWVDFVRYPVAAHTLIIVQPGCLHQFHITPDMNACLLVVDPIFMLPEHLAYLKPLLSSRPWPVCTALTPAGSHDFLALCQHLRNDLQRVADESLLAALARERLYTWLLLTRIGWDQLGHTHQNPATPSPLVHDFQALLEQHYAMRWSVQNYARKLGYTERTLNRACLGYAGQTAKTMVDARVLLEAKRLLAHSNDTVEAISYRLGFGSASPMAQFFKRLAGVTPKAFRQSLLTTEKGV